MKTIGKYTSLVGFLSIVLSFFGRNVVIISWIDNWGETIGWTIRIALFVGGLVLYKLGMIEEEKENSN